MTTSQLLLWGGFNLFVIVMLVLDLGVFQRKAHEVSIKESLIWSVIWIVLALLFAIFVYYQYPAMTGKTDLPAGFAGKTTIDYLAAYLVERALSMDNLFVFLLIFSYFRVPAEYHHRILFWGILGALIMRGIFIAAGVTLIHYLDWIIYVFGAFLVYIGIKFALQREKEIHPEKNPILKLARRFVPMTDKDEGGHFFIRRNHKLFATPLFIVLLVIETTDVIFAVDSIPAVIAITGDPFIIYTSNVFAILGLRALYFALAGIMKLFHYLDFGLSAILVFVGVKMLLSKFVHISSALALIIIAGILGVTIMASLIWPKKVDQEIQNEVEEITEK